MLISKGIHEFEHQGQTFFIHKINDIEGDLTWNIEFECFVLEKEVFFNQGEDSLWATKAEAKKMAKQFIEEHA